MTTVTREFVEALINFAPTEEQRRMGFADTQTEGTVALFNMLQRNRCAYLADEVGMGKTYVALGVMSLVRYFNPAARIIVIQRVPSGAMVAILSVMSAFAVALTNKIAAQITCTTRPMALKFISNLVRNSHLPIVEAIAFVAWQRHSVTYNPCSQFPNSALH